MNASGDENQSRVHALKKIEHAMSVLNSVRSGVHSTIADLAPSSTSALSVEGIAMKLKENIANNQENLANLISLSSKIEINMKVLGEEDEILNNKRSVEEMLKENIGGVVTTDRVYDIYGWSKRFQIHGTHTYEAYGNALSVSFPHLHKKLQSAEATNLSHSKNEAERLSDLDDIITWMVNKEPKNLIKKITGSSGVKGLLVTIPNVFNALLSLKLRTAGTYRIVINRVVVNSCDEKINIWGNSRHFVFQRLTEIFNSALLYFMDDNEDTAFSSFLIWLYSYQNLFTGKCTECQKHLGFDMVDLKLLPPIYHSFTGSHKAYHRHCMKKTTKS